MPASEHAYSGYSVGSDVCEAGTTATVTRRTVTASYTVLADDHILWVQGAGEVRLTNPDDGRVLRIKRLRGAGLITLVALQGDIEGEATYELLAEGEAVDVVGDGTRWGTH